MTLKKLIVILASVALVVGCGWFGYAKYGPGQQEAVKLNTAQVKRGQVRSSITATGKVVSNRDVDIKSKAGGTIIRMPKHVLDVEADELAHKDHPITATQPSNEPELDISDPVKAGQLMLELDPKDMERYRDKAREQVNSSQVRLDIAKKNLDIAKRTWTTDKARADAAVKAAQVHQRDAHNKAVSDTMLLDKKAIARLDYETSQTAATQADVDLDNANIRLLEIDTAKETIKQRELDVTAAESTLKSDQIALDSAQDQVDYCKVIAPIDGVISAKLVQIGNTISSSVSNVGGGTSVFTVSDLSRIFVLASVDESDIGQLIGGARLAGATSRPADGEKDRRGDGTKGRGGEGKGRGDAGTRGRGDNGEGSADGAKLAASGLPVSLADQAAAASQPDYPQRVTITADAFKGVKFSGKITRIATAGVNQSNVVTFEVQIEVTSHNKALLRPTMTANVEIITAEKNDVLTVPADAVWIHDGKRTITVIAADGKQEDRDAEIGITNGMLTEVTKGVAEGETVLVRKGGDSKWSGGPQRGGPPNVFGGARAR